MRHSREADSWLAQLSAQPADHFASASKPLASTLALAGLRLRQLCGPAGVSRVVSPTPPSGRLPVWVSQRLGSARRRKWQAERQLAGATAVHRSTPRCSARQCDGPLCPAAGWFSPETSADWTTSSPRRSMNACPCTTMLQSCWAAERWYGLRRPSTRLPLL